MNLIFKRCLRLSQRRYLLTHSSVTGALQPPLFSHTLPGYFASNILPEFSSHPALICKQESPNAYRRTGSGSGLRWTFEEMDQHIEALSKGLIDLGVQKGDRIGVVLGNCSAYALLQWTCARIGAVIVTINPSYRIHELIATMNLTGVSMLFISPTLRSTHYTPLLHASLPALSAAAKNQISDPACPSLRSIVLVDNQSSNLNLDASSVLGETIKKELEATKAAIDFRDLFVWEHIGKLKNELRKRESSLKIDDVINLQFTSGTTGAPKAVSLTHHNLLNNGYFIGECMSLTPSDKLLLGNLAAWTHRACIVYASESYDPMAILRAVEEEKCTALHGVPTHYLGVIGALERERKRGKNWDLSSLRTGIAAGTTIPIELMRKLISELNLVDLSNAYGMTETSPVSFQTIPSDPMIKRVETVGRVQPHVRAKLVDRNNNIVPIVRRGNSDSDIASPGEPGELCVSGYLVQKGYWNEEGQTNLVMRLHEDDPDTIWMHTGDLGVMDEEGYLKIVGRKKDIIIRGGENLFPVQIENIITAHHAIREAAVVSVPDEFFGEVVGAWIVRSDGGGNITREEVRELVRGGMNPQNTPDWVWFVGEDGVPGELPKTGSGKVMKNVLRDWSREWVEKGIGSVKKNRHNASS